LIRESGARYAGIAVVHHDGFGLWAGDVYRWNAGKMGPKRDLYGELVKALRAQDLQIVATTHRLGQEIPLAVFGGGSLQVDTIFG
jgi:alpha-L-fucosidase